MMRFKVMSNWLKKNSVPLIIILCAAFLRLYRLPEFAMFLADQGRDALIIHDIITFKHFPAIGPPSSIGMVYLGPFFYYLTSPFLLLTNMHPSGLAFGSALLMLTGIIISYFFVKKELGFITALVFLILTTFSFQNIEASRFSWNPNLLPVFSFLTLLFASYFAEKPTKRNGILLGIFYALSFQLHHLAAFLGASILLISLIAFFGSKKKRAYLFPTVLSITAFILISSPLILFDLKHQFLNITNVISVFTQQNVVAGGSPLTRLLDTNKNLFSMVFQLPISETVGMIVLLCLVILFGITKNKKISYLPLTHLLNIVTFTWLFSLLSSPRYPHYFGSAYFSVFLVIAYCVGSVKHKMTQYIVMAVLISGYLFLNVPHYYFINGNAGNQMQYAEAVAVSMIPHMEGKPYNIATYPIEFTSEDTFIYFLKLRGLKVAKREQHEVTDQMFVLCNKEPCRILDSQSWNIDMFGKARIAESWKVRDIHIFKLIHAN